jgi:hypothetical protein
MCYVAIWHIWKMHLFNIHSNIYLKRLFIKRSRHHIRPGKNTIISRLFKDFKFISVPDILHHGLIESCGFQTTGDRNQVYKLDYMNDYGKYCLSGTSEMSLAGLMRNQMFNKNELPLK